MIISVITINYNNLEGLKRTAESVLSQNDQNYIDYIIIDGSSTDGSLNYLKTLPRHVTWISEKDNGISDAFNKGIAKVKGDVVLMLNSGDTFVDNKVISEVLKVFNYNKYDILSFKVKVDNNTSIPSNDNPSFIWNNCEEPHQGTFVLKEVYNEIGGYSEEYRIRMDYHFFARCKDHGFRFKYIPKVIVNYEPGGVSMKKENRAKFWKEGMAVKFRYNIPIRIKDVIKILYHLF